MMKLLNKLKNISTKTKVLLVLFITFAVALGCAIGYFNDCSCFLDAKGHICSKYDIPRSKVKLVDHIPARYYNDDSLFLIYIEKSEPLWTYTYNGKEFHVTYNWFFHWYEDDYQMEKINELATAYLQENFDSRVCGVYVNCEDYDSQLFTEADVQSFLGIATGTPLRIYLKSDDPQNDESRYDYYELEERFYSVTHSSKQYGRHLSFYLIDDTVELTVHNKTERSYYQNNWSYFGMDYDYEQAAIYDDNDANPHIRWITAPPIDAD